MVFCKLSLANSLLSTSVTLYSIYIIWIQGEHDFDFSINLIVTFTFSHNVAVCISVFTLQMDRNIFSPPTIARVLQMDEIFKLSMCLVPIPLSIYRLLFCSFFFVSFIFSFVTRLLYVLLDWIVVSAV